MLLKIHCRSCGRTKFNANGRCTNCSTNNRKLLHDAETFDSLVAMLENLTVENGEALAEVVAKFERMPEEKK